LPTRDSKTSRRRRAAGSGIGYLGSRVGKLEAQLARAPTTELWAERDGWAEERDALRAAFENFSLCGASWTFGRMPLPPRISTPSASATACFWTALLTTTQVGMLRQC
jgi:hypothetical protein